MPGPDPAMRDGMIGMFELRFRDLAQELTDGKITLGDWQLEARTELRNLYALQIIAATGAENRADVNPDDWLRLGNMLQSQYGYLADFANEIQDGNLSAAQIAARSQLYAQSSKQAYWSQFTSQNDLPAQPGDGSTACHGNCGCSWVQNDDGSWSWVRGKEDSCEDCIWREANWDPWEGSIQ